MIESDLTEKGVEVISGPLVDPPKGSRMVRATHALAIALLSLAATGCVERRFVITSEPYGAVVYDWSDAPVGATPADKQFEYFGTYRFKLIKDGYQTKIVEEPIKAPWYQWPGLDFFSENVIPFTIRDIRRLHYKLDPIEPVPVERVRSEGELMRERGKAVGTPLP
jgi:hypothetical protein